MTSGTPRISIITATLNRRVLLQRAILSAMAQDVPAFEHIIIDGASTDGTLEMLRAYPHLRVISEPDSNLYEAWNKGIAQATGDIICILNSDDELPPCALAEVARLAAAEPEADLYSGAVELVRDAPVAGDLPQAGEPRATSRVVIDDPAMIGLREQDIGPGVPLTNGRFLSKRLLNRVGRFDERYPALSDRQFFLRVLLATPRHVTTSATLYRYHVHGGSLTLNDAAPSLSFALEARRAALDGLRAATDGSSRAAYARWHAWASFYLVMLSWQQRQRRAALDVVRQATGVDRVWLARLPVPVARHLLERRARRGRKIE